MLLCNFRVAITVWIVAGAANAAFANNLLATSGPLNLNTNHAAVDLADLGVFDIGGSIAGLAFLQGNPSPGDRHLRTDLDNAQVYIQSAGGRLQLLAMVGAYTLPSLGTAYSGVGRTAEMDYGYFPLAVAKFNMSDRFAVEVGKLPSLVGGEAMFTFENMNIERGLLWNQTPSISRGVQVNYDGPIALSLSWNDGFYSGRFNWISGSAAWTVPNNGGVITLNGGANLGDTAHTSFVTPLAQNNSAILNLAYNVDLGNWTLNPSLQFSNVPQNRVAGLPSGGHTQGAAILALRRINENWSIGARAEYLASGGRINLVYGPGSDAWSLTITPSYQKGMFFSRAEASYVALSNARPGSALGNKGVSDSQARLMLETGVLF